VRCGAVWSAALLSAAGPVSSVSEHSSSTFLDLLSLLLFSITQLSHPSRGASWHMPPCLSSAHPAHFQSSSRSLPAALAGTAHTSLPVASRSRPFLVYRRAAFGNYLKPSSPQGSLIFTVFLHAVANAALRPRAHQASTTHLQLLLLRLLALVRSSRPWHQIYHPPQPNLNNTTSSVERRDERATPPQPARTTYQKRRRQYTRTRQW